MVGAQSRSIQLICKRPMQERTYYSSTIHTSMYYLEKLECVYMYSSITTVQYVIFSIP